MKNKSIQQRTAGVFLAVLLLISHVIPAWAEPDAAPYGSDPAATEAGSFEEELSGEAEETEEVSEPSETLKEDNTSDSDEFSATEGVNTENDIEDSSPEEVNTENDIEDSSSAEELNTGNDIDSSSEDTQDKIMISGSGNTRTAVFHPGDTDVSGVTVAVWSAEKGQDDLVWYTLKLQDDGNYSAELKLRNLKHAGNCYAHFYAEGNRFLGDIVFTVEQDELSKNRVSVDTSGTEPVITVISEDAVSSVKAAVWSQTDGQDDLVWYTLKQREDNNWIVTVNRNKLKHAGNIYVHVYTDQNVLLGTETFQITEEELLRNTFEITGTGKERTAYASITDSRVRGVKAAIWSAEKGQDDIVWYTLKMQQDGSYAVDLNLGRIQHAGNCHAHFYSSDDRFLGAVLFQIAEDDLPKNSILINKEKGNPIITVSTDKAASTVKAAVWSATGGQDDLVWYTLKEKDGIWTGVINCTRLKHSGKIFVHVYRDKDILVGTSSFQLTSEELTGNKVSVTESGGFRIVNAEVADSTVKGIRAAVWSGVGGQDDLKWYSLSKSSTNVWSGEVNLRMLKHTGRCYAHLYTTGNKWVGSAEFTVSEGEIPDDTITVSGTGDSRVITVWTGTHKNLTAAVWSATGGQDDLKWYSLTKQSEGCWSTSVLLKNLKHSGKVYIHCYADSNSSFIGSATMNVNSITSSEVSYNPNLRLVSHRGYSASAPENTLAAYALAKEMGYEYIETDVTFTSDGTAVLLHDSTIDRTSNGTGSISDLTLEEVKALDFGSWKSSSYQGEPIPTLDEFLNFCKQQEMKPYIELKTIVESAEERVQNIVDLVQSYDLLSQTTFISFDAPLLHLIKNFHPKSRLGYLFGNDINDSVIATAKSLYTGENEVFLDAQYSHITEEGIKAAIAAELPLEVWTIDSRTKLSSLDYYISGVTSNKLTAEQLP